MADPAAPATLETILAELRAAREDNAKLARFLVEQKKRMDLLEAEFRPIVSALKERYWREGKLKLPFFA